MHDQTSTNMLILLLVASLAIPTASSAAAVAPFIHGIGSAAGLGQVEVAYFHFDPVAHPVAWSTQRGLLAALQAAPGLRVREYNLMGPGGDFIEPSNGRPGGIVGLSRLVLARFAHDVGSGLYNPSVVLVSDFGSYPWQELGKSLAPGALWVLECGDDPQRFAANAARGGRYDVLLTPDLASVEQYEESGLPCLNTNNTSTPRVHWMTHHAGIYPADLQRHLMAHHQHLPGAYSERPHNVVTSCGQRGTVPAIAAQLRARHDIEVVNARATPGAAHHDLLASGRIVLNQAKYGEVTRRIFEAMLAGSLVVTDALHPSRGLHKVSQALNGLHSELTHTCLVLPQLFTPGRDIVTYSSTEEAVELLHHYTRHPEEAERMAAAGQLSVLQHHTASARAAQLEQLLRYHLMRGTASAPCERRASKERKQQCLERPVVHEVQSDGSSSSDAESPTRRVLLQLCDGENPYVTAARFCGSQEAIHLPQYECVASVGDALSSAAEAAGFTL